MAYFSYFLFIIFLFPLYGYTDTLKNQNKSFRNFWHPTYQGARLNYCMLDGRKCGKEVADHYCKILGYKYSSQNEIAYNLGLTNYLFAKEHCKGWGCNGFMTITCAMNLSHNPPKPYHYRERNFVVPRFKGYRIDWCYSINYDCGSRAANSFCSRKGFMKAKSFMKENGVSITRTIGSQELCFGKKCNAFKSIVCYR